MSLISEIEKLMNIADASFNYRIINLGGKSLYVEGIKSVISLGENEIVITYHDDTGLIFIMIVLFVYVIKNLSEFLTDFFMW